MLFYVKEHRLSGRRTRHEGLKEAECKSSDYGDEGGQQARLFYFDGAERS
jgi:hypothetical protein